jgi:ribA/ribD-fused uncharacterized protein
MKTLSYNSSVPNTVTPPIQTKTRKTQLQRHSTWNLPKVALTAAGIGFAYFAYQKLGATPPPPVDDSAGMPLTLLLGAGAILTAVFLSKTGNTSNTCKTPFLSNFSGASHSFRPFPSVNDASKTHFLNEMERTMGPRLYDYQKETLSDLFDEAMRTPQPRTTFQNLINQKINQADGWSAEKKQHISKNLLDCLPETNSDQPEVDEVPQTFVPSLNKNVVCFYKNGPTAFLGNFAECPQSVKIYGKTFKCSEAAFQWRKYYLAAQDNRRNDLLKDPKMSQFFTCDGEGAFRLNRALGHKYSNVFPDQWKNGKRDEVMWEVLNAKFSQNPEFSNLLQKTGDAYLLEHNEAQRDDYWSDNGNGTGKNILGKMLMAIRDGKDCPPPDHAIDQDDIETYADYVNQRGVLQYQIF